MALDQSALLELLDALKAGDADDVVRRAVEAVFQALIDAEATARIGAEPKRTETRTTQRNGYRDRLLTTAAGDVELRIPKLRTGSFFPSLLAAPSADRSGAVRGGDGGLRDRHLDPQGRRSGGRDGRGHRHLQERGEPDLRRPGR